MPSSAPATSAGGSNASRRSTSPVHEQRLLDARRHVGIEPPRLGVRGNRLLEETAVAARVDETCEEFRIVAMPVGLVQQTNESTLRLTDVGLEIRVELVRDRQMRIELERPAECVLGPRLALGRRSHVLADHAMTAPEVRPRRGKS